MLISELISERLCPCAISKVTNGHDISKFHSGTFSVCNSWGALFVRFMLTDIVFCSGKQINNIAIVKLYAYLHSRRACLCKRILSVTVIPKT